MSGNELEAETGTGVTEGYFGESVPGRPPQVLLKLAEQAQLWPSGLTSRSSGLPTLGDASEASQGPLGLLSRDSCPVGTLLTGEREVLCPQPQGHVYKQGNCCLNGRLPGGAWNPHTHSPANAEGWMDRWTDEGMGGMRKEGGREGRKQGMPGGPKLVLTIHLSGISYLFSFLRAERKKLNKSEFWNPSECCS